MSEIENKLKSRIENDKAHTFLLIVPNNAVRLKCEHRLIAYHPDGAVVNLQVQPIESFIQRLYSQVDRPKQHISSGIQRLWIHDIANRDNEGANHNETFRPNRNISVPDSTLSLIVETINNLRERDETQLNFVEDSQTKSDLESIYRNYENKLGSQWIDEQSKHLFLADNFNETLFKSAFPKVDLIVFESFTVLSNANIKLLKRIARSNGLEMWFRADCLSVNENLYQNITNLVREIDEVGVNIDPDYERDSELHQYFAENLFKTKNPSVEKRDLTNKITLLEPSDRLEEVEQIAHIIQTIVSEEACKLSDICVAYYNFAKYQKRIAETFSAYGIPYSLSENIPLAKSEVVKEIFLRLASNQNSQGFTYFSDIQNASDETRYHPNEFLASVSNIINDGDTLLSILNPMLQKNSEIVEGEINALQSFKKILKELCTVLNSEGERAYSINVLVSKLRYIAKHTYYQKRALRKIEAVKVLPLGELRSSEFYTVFLGDFVDGGFPIPYRSDPLLPETPYRTENEHLHDNRFLFYRVLKAFRKKLYLMTPKRDRDAELIPSVFKEQLEEIVQIGTDELEDVGLRSLTGFLSSYGEYVWKTDNPHDDQFPSNVRNMRPLIDHVVSVEKGREGNVERSHHDGYLTIEDLDPESSDKLETLRDETYSVTDLEMYAKCPFQYFMKNVLKTKVEEEDEEDELSSLDKGKLTHNILYRFYMNLRDTNENLINSCNDDEFEIAMVQLNNLLIEITDEIRSHRNTSADNLFWLISTDKLQTALFRWLEAERCCDLSVLDRFFEVSFGRSYGDADPELSDSDPISIGNVKMAGKIDRIDMGGEYFNVIDYKTGSSKIVIQDILEGRSLQLPIYLKIAQKLLKQLNEQTELNPAAGLYYKIRLRKFEVDLGIGIDSQNGITFRGYNGSKWYNFGKTNRQILGELSFTELLERVSGYVQQYVDNIAKGVFPLITRVDTYTNSEDEGDAPITPKELTKPCSYCNFKRQCRVRAFEEEYQVET